MGLNLRSCGPTAGDCTTPYDVIIKGEYTVASFIEEVDVNDNWGAVYVKREPFWFGGDKVCDYGRGKTVKNTDEYDDCKVVSAHAHGGWSRYDFYLEVR